MAMAPPATIDNISKKGGKQKKDNAKANNNNRGSTTTTAVSTRSTTTAAAKQQMVQGAINEHHGMYLVPVRSLPGNQVAWMTANPASHENDLLTAAATGIIPTW